MRFKLGAFVVLLLGLLFTGSAYAKTIEGEVRDARWGPNAVSYLNKVKVYPKSNPDNVAETDENGKYVLQNVDDNEEFIVFEKSGYVTDMKKINGDKLDMALVETGLTTISDQEFFNTYLNMDYPGMEKVKSAWEQGDILMAKYEMVEYYRTRETPVWNVKPQKPEDITPDLNYSTTVADQMVNHVVTLQGVESSIDTYPGSHDINWITNPTGDREWPWQLNRFPTLLELSKAWVATLDSKYSYEYMAEYIDWIADNPKPFYLETDKITLSAWRTIEVAIRNHYPIPDSWYRLMYCDELTTETHMSIIKSALEHMEYLASYSGGGNWLIFECRGLYTLATLHPEFQKSAEWKALAEGRSLAQLVGQFKPDGWQYEATPNYHMEAANSLSEIEKVATLNGTSTALKDGLKKAFDINMLLMLPGGKPVPLNDTNNTSDYRGNVRNAASLFGDLLTATGQDYIYASSDFRAGKAPQQSSIFYEYPGYAVMRDYFGPNNITGFFEGGPSGVGTHGWNHRDKLQFVMSAYGRDMLVEPSIYSYSGEPIAKYMFSTVAHNTITVDGEEQVRRMNGMEEPAENVVYHEGAGYDFSSALYNEKFGETALIDVEHNRKVMFDKNGFFFINDYLTGDGEHDISQYWNIASCNWTHNQATNMITAQYDDGTGFILLPVSAENLQFDAVAGSTDPYRGWQGNGTNMATPIPSLRFYTTGSELPLTIDTFIMPFKGEVPQVSAKALTTSSADATGIQVTLGDGRVIYYLSNNGSGSVTYGDFTFDGEMAIITKNTDGTVNVKKYPEESTLSESGRALSNVTVEVVSPSSADILNTNTAVLQANVVGLEQADVEFFAAFQQDGETKTQSIATCKSGETATWDLSNIENQAGVRIWAVVTDNGSKIISNENREITIQKEAAAAQQLELEDRVFPKSDGAVAMADGRSNANTMIVLQKDQSVSGSVTLPSQAAVKLRARTYDADTAKLTVTVNGQAQELTLTPDYQWFELGNVTDSLQFTITNAGEQNVCVDSLGLTGEGIEKANNKVLHHRLDLIEDESIFGSTDLTDYVVSAKVKFQHMYVTEGGGGITARRNDNGGYGLYYDGATGQLQIRQKAGTSWSVINQTAFSWDKSKWYQMKLKVEGNQLSAKVWEASQPEPEEWILQTEITAGSGTGALSCNRSDMLFDDIQITAADGAETIYSADMEGVLSGSRPSGLSTTKADAWVCDDMMILQ